MATLGYTAITSLDGFIEDEDGGFDWAAPDPDLHAYFNDLDRATGTSLYGRRMYETMAVWQTWGEDTDTDVPEVERDYAEVWKGLDKVVYSTTLEEVWTPRTRLERTFDPDAVRRIKDEADRPVSVSGPGLAASAFAAGLVDEVSLIVIPVIVGGGKSGLPGGAKLDLELAQERTLPGGVVHLRYRIR
jgi:dihydrofolate reductase